MTAYFPLTRHMGSSLSSRSAVPSASPTHTSALSVRRVSRFSLPARGPMASTKGVVLGHRASLQTHISAFRYRNTIRDDGHRSPCQLAVVEVSLEDDQSRLLQLLQQRRRSLGYKSKRQRVRPVALWRARSRRAYLAQGLRLREGDLELARRQVGSYKGNWERIDATQPRPVHQVCRGGSTAE